MFTNLSRTTTTKTTNNKQEVIQREGICSTLSYSLYNWKTYWFPSHEYILQQKLKGLDDTIVSLQKRIDEKTKESSKIMYDIRMLSANKVSIDGRDSKKSLIMKNKRKLLFIGKHLKSLRGKLFKFQQLKFDLETAKDNEEIISQYESANKYLRKINKDPDDVRELQDDMDEVRTDMDAINEVMEQPMLQNMSQTDEELLAELGLTEEDERILNPVKQQDEITPAMLKAIEEGIQDGVREMKKEKKYSVEVEKDARANILEENKVMVPS